MDIYNIVYRREFVCTNLSTSWSLSVLPLSFVVFCLLETQVCYQKVEKRAIKEEREF